MEVVRVVKRVLASRKYLVTASSNRKHISHRDQPGHVEDKLDPLSSQIPLLYLLNITAVGPAEPGDSSFIEEITSASLRVWYNVARS